MYKKHLDIERSGLSSARTKRCNRLSVLKNKTTNQLKDWSDFMIEDFICHILVELEAISVGSFEKSSRVYQYTSIKFAFVCAVCVCVLSFNG